MKHPDLLLALLALFLAMCATMYWISRPHPVKPVEIECVRIPDTLRPYVDSVSMTLEFK